MISVLIVDDHPVVRQGLRALLEVQDDIMVVGEAGDGPAAVSLATSLSPDIVLLDLKLPGMDGVAVLQPLSAAGLRVLVLTSATDPAALSGCSTARPSMPGSLRSSSTMSGDSEVARDTAVCPSPASPTTTMSSCTSSSARSPCRTTGWSSTMSTLIMPAPPA